jgi:hypothetical protein
MPLKTIDTVKDNGKCCNSEFKDKQLVTLRSCGSNPVCATHVMPVSRQMNFASHTIKQKANERKFTKLIVNDCKQYLCRSSGRTINDIKEETEQNLLIPQRTNREYIRDNIFKNSSYCSDQGCNIGGVDKVSTNLRTQNVRRRNIKYFKDSAVSASSRIDRLKAELSRKDNSCCPPSINPNKQEICCPKKQPNQFLRFKR